jgi:type II secretory pathway component GspD/PulD (secretin)
MKHNGLKYATWGARCARLVLLTMALTLLASCDNSGTETRTFALKQIAPKEALGLVEGYVPGGTANIRATEMPRALTVTAPRSRLDQITQVLATYDKAAPNAQLTFQIIEADGFTQKDPAIADVEAAVREVFKFTGYRLLAEGMVIAHPPGAFRQVIGKDYVIEGGIEAEGTDAVRLQLELYKMFPILKTSVVVPYGETVVVGSSPAGPGTNAIILVVRNKMK